MAAKYVLFEGIDGAGKSGLVKCVGTYLNSLCLNPLLTREPGSDADPICAGIRTLIKSGAPLVPETAVFLFMADRAQHNSMVVQPAHSQGRIILQDRGFLSTYAYQGYGHGWDLAQLKALNKMSASRPDLIVWVDTHPDVAWERISSRVRDQFETRSFQRRVYNGFSKALDYARAGVYEETESPFPWPPPPMLVIDGSKNMQANVGDVVEAIVDVS